jgi:DNA repair exonuclease SbcCD ATPase subunit
MKVKSIVIAGFRGFPRIQKFDLDADAVIVAGANGSGKTSLFDALLWGLTGSIPRIQGEATDLVSKYSPSGEARVELLLGTDEGTEMQIVRRFDGRDHLTVDNGGGEVSGPAAETKLLEALWPDAKFAPEPKVALSRSLTRATYLQQDLVRQFVESDSDQDRFQVVSELVGVGRVEELQRQLEGSRNNWSRATNAIERDIAPLRSQLSAVQERIARLGALDTDVVSEDVFVTWIEAAKRFVSGEESNRLLSDRSAQSLDRALTALQARQLSEERRATALERLVEHLARPVAIAPESTSLEEAERAAQATFHEVSQRLSAAQEQAAQRRREQVEQAEHRESLRTLAQLALQHLGETCPVCDQTYDEVATRARLSELMSDDASHDAAGRVDSVQDAATQVEVAERHLAEVRAQLRATRSNQENRRAWEQALARLAGEVELEPSEGLKDRAEESLADARGVADAISHLRADGELLSVQLARSVELAQRGDLEKQAGNLSRDLATREKELTARVETGELASLLLERLRDVNAGVISTELRRIEPLLQRIYAQVDPHPSFRAVNFLTRTVRGRGRLWTSLSDRTADVSVSEPSIVLSSSQLNVLALSTFLSLNLAIESLPLQVVALDDPLQSLDTVNLLGLADLLRRIKVSRQVIVSTHDERLAALLARKLRPISAGEQTRLIRLQAWSREGPVVEQEAVPADVPPLRLVVSA